MDPQHLRISCPPSGSSANFIASGMQTHSPVFLIRQVFEKLKVSPSRKKTIE
jgi:hypothetical protein